MIIAFFASLGYLASALLLYADKRAHHRLFIAMGIAFGAHFIQITAGLKDVFDDMTIVNVLTLTAFCMATLGGLRYFLSADKITYTIVALVSAVCVWFPVIISPTVTKVESWGIKVHAAFSIAAYIALSFATLYALFLLIKDTWLRGRKSFFDIGLPLSYIERTMMRFTIFGEILLTLSLATGLLFISDIWAQHILHKIIFGAISWVIIGAVLLGHYRQGFRGRQAAWWLLLGFVCLVLSYFGTAFVLQIILKR